MSETEGLQSIVKPTQATAATNKSSSLAAQDTTIASASVGSLIYRSPAAFLTVISEAKGYQK